MLIELPGGGVDEQFAQEGLAGEAVIDVMLNVTDEFDVAEQLGADD